jgi:hypothetical protein
LILEKLQQNYNKNKILYNTYENKITNNIISMRIESIKKQVRCLYNLGDEYLRKTLNKIFDNQFKISYEHNWSNEGYAVGTIGGTLDIIFYRNFFEPTNLNDPSHSDVMKYAGCITLEGAIRSMLLHELGHVNFRGLNKMGKWLSSLKDSHNEEWANWVTERMIKFNYIAKDIPEMLIGFMIFSGFNITYKKADYYLLKILTKQYNTILKPNGYIADSLMFPNVKTPFDW